MVTLDSCVVRRCCRSLGGREGGSVVVEEIGRPAEEARKEAGG
jgi:hypothetical protein